ncbi:MAG: hypothetical protein HZB25_10235 [Candidatus Eisenbacteria bacterium]|nr:hypothetical protein [Candidatus Eisenbacteria bacterium]
MNSSWKNLAAAFIAAAALAATLVSALPQASAADPRSFAMGSTDVVTARGADAVAWNPALLGLPSAPSVSVRLFQAGVRADNNSFDLDQYRRFNGADWGDPQKSEILGSVPVDGLRLQAAARAGAGFSIGRFGFYADGLGDGDGRFARDGVDFALYGNSLDRTYQVTGTGGTAFASARAVLGFAMPLARTSDAASAAGIQVAYERGIRWEDGSTLEGTFRAATDTAEVAGEFLLREGTRGDGFSLGLGYAKETASGGRVSVAVRDLFNRTRWTGTDRRFHLRGTHGMNSSDNIDSLFTSSEDPAVPASFTTRRAAVASLGVEQFRGPLNLALVVEKGLGESPGVSKQFRGALGAEWHGFGPVALRGGISSGGGKGTWYSGGLGVHAGPWKLDLAVASRGLSYGSRGVGVAVGSSIEM